MIIPVFKNKSHYQQKASILAHKKNVAISSKNWFGPVKGYSLLDQITST